jgi:hypothetical protein
LKKKKPVVAAVILALALLGLIAYSTMGLTKVRVEVCMEFEGRTNCRITSGSTKDFAIRSAIQNACADMASGVTQTMQCQATAPTKITDLK